MGNKRSEVNTLVNIIQPLFVNKKYEGVKNQISKFIKKNKTEDFLSPDIAIL